MGGNASQDKDRGDMLTPGQCSKNCGRPAAVGFPTCCRTCDGSGRHGPRCEAEFRASQDKDEGETLMEGLLRLVQHGAVRLVLWEWLQAQADAGGILVRRQEVPEHAFVPVAEVTMEKLKRDLVSISHAWLSRNHPDPTGCHLRLFRTGGPIHELIPAVTLDEKCVFWDFVSLFQVPRNDEQERLFKMALESMHCVYGTVLDRLDGGGVSINGVVVRLLDVPTTAENATPYVERGWCFFESVICSNGGKYVISITDGKMQDVELLQIPLAPEEFNGMLDKKKFTSKKADTAKVKELYAKIWKNHAPMKLLSLCAKMSDAQVHAFLKVKPHLKNFVMLYIQDGCETEEGRRLMTGASVRCFEDYSSEFYVFKATESVAGGCLRRRRAFSVGGRSVAARSAADSKSFLLPECSFAKDPEKIESAQQAGQRRFTYIRGTCIPLARFSRWLFNHERQLPYHVPRARATRCARFKVAQ